MSGILVGAHRGAMCYAPENSLAAFDRAVECGTDRCEFDVRLSADGHVVVMHDETVDRTTDGRGRVGDLSRAQLRRLRLEGTQERVPDFAAAATCMKDRCRMLVEIKAPGMVAKLLAAIAAVDVVSQCTISSFDEDSLRQVRRADTGVGSACFVRPGLPFDVPRLVADLGIDMVVIPPATHRAGIDPELLAQAREAGLHLRCGLPDDMTYEQTRQEVQRLVGLGMNEISCGRPDWIRRALAASSA